MTLTEPEANEAGDGIEPDDWYAYGQPRARAWTTSPAWGGEMAISIRRPELLDDHELDAWWHDLKTWTTWAVHTFRLSRTFPPCWPEHPQLVEELMALWLLWQQVWLPAEDAFAPAQFLHHLDAAISRCERVWKLPCDPKEHKPPTPLDIGAHGEPTLRRWWGNDHFNLAETSA